jgi:hypothetical protein
MSSVFNIAFMMCIIGRQVISNSECNWNRGKPRLVVEFDSTTPSSTWWHRYKPDKSHKISGHSVLLYANNW